MKIGVVACEAFKKEIELLTKGDCDIAHMEFLEFGLHVYPKKMNQVLIEKANSLEGKVDSVFLCYGYCQSLKGITSELRIPTTMLEVDDCIGAVLTPEGYDEERKKCAGTWFATPLLL